jgi:hypothetical protein
MAHLRHVRVGHAGQVEVKTGAEPSTYMRMLGITPSPASACSRSTWLYLTHRTFYACHMTHTDIVYSKIQTDLGAPARIKVI